MLFVTTTLPVNLPVAMPNKVASMKTFLKIANTTTNASLTIATILLVVLPTLLSVMTTTLVPMIAVIAMKVVFTLLVNLMNQISAMNMTVTLLLVSP
jgi:hypothetical protein